MARKNEKSEEQESAEQQQQLADRIKDSARQIWLAGLGAYTKAEPLYQQTLEVRKAKLGADHPDVAECAVLGVEDTLKGQIPVGFLVLNAGVARDHAEIIKEVVQMVRDRIGPVAAFKMATVVKRLPKTRSGKILRGTIQKIADNKERTVPATIDDPATLEEIETALESIGLAKARIIKI